MQLRYGMNPHRAPASVVPVGDALPYEVLSGRPGYINLLDALNSWQLVRAASAVTGEIAATSFKHVSPTGVAIPGDVPAFMLDAYEVAGSGLSEVATAYFRARSSDPRSSYGDFIAVSAEVDESAARLIRKVVSDGIIAPGYSPEALEILKEKKKGGYLILKADANYEPPTTESREVFGVRLTEARDNAPIISATELSETVAGKLTPATRRDLLLGIATVKFTQSNTIAYVRDGHVIGIGAGQQSRIDCTRLAGEKATNWRLIQHPRVLSSPAGANAGAQGRISELYGVAAELTETERAEWLTEFSGLALVSDGYIPFEDNVLEAHSRGVSAIACPPGSIRDDAVAKACRKLGITLVYTAHRYFHH